MIPGLGANNVSDLEQSEVESIDSTSTRFPGTLHWNEMAHLFLVLPWFMAHGPCMKTMVFLKFWSTVPVKRLVFLRFGSKVPVESLVLLGFGARVPVKKGGFP